VTALGRSESLRLEALSSPGPRAVVNPQAALRADIRRLGDLLEQSLARQEGPGLPALVGPRPAVGNPLVRVAVLCDVLALVAVACGAISVQRRGRLLRKK